MHHAPSSSVRLAPQDGTVFPTPRHEPAELLDESAGFLGMGRSTTFPFVQRRAHDRYRTVFFDEGQGPALLFVHGLGGNATHWEFVARALASRYRVIGLDLVGSGWSEKPHCAYTLEMLRDHVLVFMEQQDISQATLVGHSLGGAVCLALALLRPERVTSLALLCAAGVAPLPRWMRVAAPLFLRERLLYPTLRYGANFIVNNVFVDSAEENPQVQWFRQTAMRDEPGNPNLRDFARVCTSLCWNVVKRDYADQLRALTIPVLALWGDADKLTSLPGVLDRLDRLQRVRTIILRRCGHLPMIERPAETIYHLERFLLDPP